VGAIALAGVCGVLVVAATLSGGSDDGGWFLATVAAISAGVCGLIAVRRQRWWRRDGALTAAARDLWQNTLYCAGCDSVFLPGRRAVPATRLHAALRETAAKRLASSAA
jgi:hypothetical protein